MVRCGRGTQLLGESTKAWDEGNETLRRRFQGGGSDFEEEVRFRGEGGGEGGPLLLVGTRRLYDMYADCKICTQTTNTIDFTPPHCRASEES